MVKMNQKHLNKILQLYERRELGPSAASFQHLKPEDISACDKLILVGKFLTSQKHISDIFFPTNSTEATQVFDLVTKVLGYVSEKSVVYEFRDIELDYTGGIGGVIPTNSPTLGLYSYRKNNNRLYQVLLYEDSADYYYHLPKDSKILANLENPDFKGDEFDIYTLKEPLPTFLNNELNTKVKEVDKVELLKLLSNEANENINRFKGDWKELTEGCFLR